MLQADYKRSFFQDKALGRETRAFLKRGLLQVINKWLIGEDIALKERNSIRTLLPHLYRKPLHIFRRFHFEDPWEFWREQLSWRMEKEDLYQDLWILVNKSAKDTRKYPKRYPLTGDDYFDFQQCRKITVTLIDLCLVGNVKDYYKKILLNHLRWESSGRCVKDDFGKAYGRHLLFPMLRASASNTFDMERYLEIKEKGREELFSFSIQEMESESSQKGDLSKIPVL